MAVASRLTSRQHPLVRRCRELAAGRGTPGEVLLDGRHLVDEALASGVPLRAVIADARAMDLAGAAAATDCPVFEVSRDLLDSMSPVRASTGIVAVAAWRPAPVSALFSTNATVVVGLVDVQDPGNVGGIIRTAEALGASGVLALGETADPGGWKALRAAMGSTFRLPVARGTLDEAVAAARAARVTVAVTVAREGLALPEAQVRPPVLVLLGNEGAGLPAPVVADADVRVSIPMRAGVNSLNVGVSAALILWEIARPAPGVSPQP